MADKSIRSVSLEQISREARRLKKNNSEMSRHKAQDEIARKYGYNNFHHAGQVLGRATRKTAAKPSAALRALVRLAAGAAIDPASLRGINDTAMADECDMQQAAIEVIETFIDKHAGDLDALRRDSGGAGESVAASRAQSGDEDLADEEDGGERIWIDSRGVEMNISPEEALAVVMALASEGRRNKVAEAEQAAGEWTAFARERQQGILRLLRQTYRENEAESAGS